MNSANFNQSFFAAGFLGLMLLSLALGGERVAAFLQYDRAAILEGQWWRMLTGHLTHAGVAHLLLNLAGLALVAGLVGRSLPVRVWILCLAACMVGVSAGQLFFCPELEWYRGFSGVLHGFMAAGLVGALLQPGQNKLLGLCGLVLVAGKLLVELLVGPTGGSLLSPETTVVVEAHLFGALAGALVATLALSRSRAATPLLRNGRATPHIVGKTEATRPADKMPECVDPHGI